MNLEQAVKDFKALQKRLQSYIHIMWLMDCDRSTVAPKAAAAFCGETQGIVAEIRHRELTSSATGDLIAYLEENREQLDYHSQKELEVLRRTYDRAIALPAEVVSEYQTLSARCASAWEKAKSASDFSIVAPRLQEMVELCKRMAAYDPNGLSAHAYWIREHELDFTIPQLDTFFDRLRGTLPALIREVGQRGRAIDDSFLFTGYDMDKQRQLASYMMDVFCMDRQRSVILESEHPFTSDYNNCDVRITNHYYPDNFKSSMYAAIHEGGHALSYLFSPDENNYTIVYGLPSSGTGEGQSRFQENIVGRSRQFISFIAPKLHELFPQQLKGISDEQLYLAINKSQPSLIRIHADELTYSLHILVRYQLEKELLDGDLKVADLPRRWNQLYEEYLGVKVPDDKRGCLQDTHWYSGGFGGFVGYALGNAYSAQQRSAIMREMDFYGNIAKGDMMPHLQWQAEHIYKHGSMHLPQELIRISTGEELNVQHYIDYLTEKFTDIYQL